jgi:hypothetical protein
MIWYVLIILLGVYYVYTFVQREFYTRAQRINPGFGTQLGKYQMYPLEIHNPSWYNAMTRKQGSFSKYISYLQERPVQDAAWALTSPH